MDSESYCDHIESLRAEIGRCKADIEKHLVSQYCPCGPLSGLDFRKDPRLAVQVRRPIPPFSPA
jgi:hypothetical protein